ncbi:Heavy metal translocatin protein [Rutstroemia sp. NJR-2017a WRK4]|nr:Heavy metal translocatin protein [Rutstroemia sp. NJR-2017a WRK4]
MSTAIAMAPSPVPHDRASYVDIAPSKPSNSPPAPAQRTPVSVTPNMAAATAAQRTGSGSPNSTPARASPNSSRLGGPPKIIVKKEPPSSPEIQASSRHRPRKLDLTKNTSSVNPGTGRPSASQLTSRGAESGGLGIQDVGLACLSPGFVTQDPTMREQLQRSISVREQQRHIIESRLQQTAKPGDAPMESAKEREASGLPMKTPGTSRRKAPPGLSIVAPSHEQFANERVIQSAPLNQSFTGRHQPHPLTRHIANQPSNLSNTSHIHHVPAQQTANRLPPITDVFAQEGLGAHRETPRAAFYPNSGSNSNSSHSNSRPGFPSPGHGPQPPASAGQQRPREYRSAEEAQADLAGGRPELLPKLVHYGNHQQPPTPPSPSNINTRAPETARSGGGRRRPRAEYEEGASPPLGNGPSAQRRTGPFGEGRDSPMTTQKKKEEFMRLCDRAWDLFHS